MMAPMATDLSRFDRRATARFDRLGDRMAPGTIAACAGC
jgi:hypothetical protein